MRDNTVELLLREPSFISAALMADAINQVFTNSAHAVDSTSVQVHMPEGAENNPMDFIAALEDIEDHAGHARAHHHQRAHRHDCRHGERANFQLRRRLRQHHDQHRLDAGRFAAQLRSAKPAQTVVTPRTTTDVTENKASLVTLPELPTVEKVAAALNTLGVTPRDMMAIFQAMKQAGALQAELLIR